MNNVEDSFKARFQDYLSHFDIISIIDTIVRYAYTHLHKYNRFQWPFKNIVWPFHVNLDFASNVHIDNMLPSHLKNFLKYFHIQL